MKRKRRATALLFLYKMAYGASSAPRGENFEQKLCQIRRGEKHRRWRKLCPSRRENRARLGVTQKARRRRIPIRQAAFKETTTYGAVLSREDRGEKIVQIKAHHSPRTKAYLRTSSSWARSNAEMRDFIPRDVIPRDTYTTYPSSSRSDRSRRWRDRQGRRRGSPHRRSSRGSASWRYR